MTDIKIENDFNDSIKKYKTIKFDFEEDGLTEQSNYFSNSKLKFLTLISRGETIERKEKYIFNTSTGKINTLYLRVEDHDQEENTLTNFTDTVRIIDFSNKTVKTLVDDKLIKLKNDNRFLKDDYNWAHQIKRITEEKYNSTQK